ncbi:hypothetical protein I4F81_004644 [Pyropia yezoensis]|uniref:Uncharacterized protein n=1 Tax=Pyropia yezoensis TaxID=2788 RepID=A0ACC3BWV6_PYRYE|nr:hypothetical protein I4F81_004644 [Neopyropia yezoensis]
MDSNAADSATPEVAPTVEAPQRPETAEPEPVLLLQREESGRSAKKKIVEPVVLHGDNTDRYLCSSEDGVAHVLDLTAGATENWFKDGPNTWGAPKGAGSTMVNISGRWKRYSARKRTCIPPLACSLMPAAVANLALTTVYFDNPT